MVFRSLRPGNAQPGVSLRFLSFATLINQRNDSSSTHPHTYPLRVWFSPADHRNPPCVPFRELGPIQQWKGFQSRIGLAGGLALTALPPKAWNRTVHLTHLLVRDSSSVSLPLLFCQPSLSPPSQFYNGPRHTAPSHIRSVTTPARSPAQTGAVTDPRRTRGSTGH